MIWIVYMAIAVTFFVIGAVTGLAFVAKIMGLPPW
jgi:hypothetical protein